MTAKLLSAMLVGSALLLPMTAQHAAAADKNVLMVLWKGETPADKAFKERLAELGVTAKYTAVDANQDRAKLGGELRNLEGDIAKKSFDAVYTYGTVATQMATTIVRNQVPVVFNIVFDPVAAELVKSKDKPGVPVTGATNGVPIPDQFDAFVKLKPIKTLLVLYNVREPNSAQIEAQVTEWAKKNGVTVQSRRVAPGTETLKEFLEEYKSGKVSADAVYAGADNYLASVAKEIQGAIGDKVVLLGGTQTFVQAGWLAAYTPLVADMGKASAEIMAKILGGADAAATPVVLPKPKLFLSKAASAKHGVAIPAGAETEN